MAQVDNSNKTQLIFFPATMQQAISAHDFRSKSALRFVQSTRFKILRFLPTELAAHSLNNPSLYLLTSDHFSNTYSLAIPQDMAFSEDMIIESTPDLRLILLKLKNLWTLRQTASIECTIFETTSGSLITVGMLSIGASSRGIIVILKKREIQRFLNISIPIFGSSPVIIDLGDTFKGNGDSDYKQQAILILKLLKTHCLL